MFKDDRLISYLTAVVLMLVIGTFASRYDPEPTPPQPLPGLRLSADTAQVMAGGLVRIDVLANDAGLPPHAGAGLRVTLPPPCGRLFVQDQALQYLADPGCAGAQSFAYGLDSVPDQASGVIQIHQPLALPDPGGVTLSAAVGAPSADPGAQPNAQPNAQPELRKKLANNLDPTLPTPSDPAARPQQPAATGAPRGAAAPAAPLRRPIDTAAGGLARTATTPDPATASPTDPAATPGAAAAPATASPGDPTAAPGAAAALATASPGDPTATPGAAPAPLRAAADPAATPGAAAAPATASPGDPTATPGAAAALATASPTDPTATPGAAPDPLRAAAAPAPDVAASPGAAPGPLAADPAPPPGAAPGPLVADPALPPGAATDPLVAAPAQPALDPATPGRLAALPPSPCVTPARATVDPGAVGLTTITLDAPCQAGTVAELVYLDLTLALPLDPAGRGRIDLPVLAPSAPADLRLAGGQVVNLTVTGRDLARVDRVAVGWSGPAALALRAREFGAPDPIGPDRPGDPAQARGRGGGFLSQFAPVSGLGQSVQIYSFVRPDPRVSGVIGLGIDYAADACATPGAAAPRYLVRRLGQDGPERALLGQMPQGACKPGAAPPRGAPAAAALTDLVILPR